MGGFIFPRINIRLLYILEKKLSVIYTAEIIQQILYAKTTKYPLYEVC